MTKEFFQLLVEQLVTPDFGMFAWLEETRCFWFASTGAALEAEAEFLLVGLVVGLAIHNGVILDLHFPRTHTPTHTRAPPPSRSALLPLADCTIATPSHRASDPVACAFALCPRARVYRYRPAMAAPDE